MFITARYICSIIICTVILTACSVQPPEAYFNRGAPESLLDVSSEVVNMDVSSPQSLDELSAWINQDQPTRAELYCVEDDPSCAAAADVLALYGVPTTFVPSTDYAAALMYERVLARDCEQRFIDNHVNPYALNHPTFGCANAANMVQMVSDRQQFVSPNLLDYVDAEKAVQVYKDYSRPPPDRSNEESDIGESTLDDVGDN